jgi:hypothetical protein
MENLLKNVNLYYETFINRFQYSDFIKTLIAKIIIYTVWQNFYPQSKN